VSPPLAGRPHLFLRGESNFSELTISQYCSGLLTSALSGDLDLANQLKKKMKAVSTIKPRASKRPHKVNIDNESSSFFTIIEVFTYDFPGLLFAITDAIYHANLDIWVIPASGPMTLPNPPAL